ncbi:hypothetical protein GOBAR_AA40071 [Gossypium barbadense]|uniref:Serine/threonine-protein phosphatase n=1 Tax=Gossypium barbadense TaxID=3634 RepID=A0A2P5VP65_GOSBA|nr:hypothetical protein GOBAR_AA40071 [Gossypium barbadense]
MDVDSSMVLETGQNHSGGSQLPAPMEREPQQQNQQLENQDSSSGPGGSLSSPAQQQAVPAASDGQGQAQTTVAGPRCAPPYSVVDAIIEKKEDGPGPRCGHTLTAVAAVGEEGTPGYIGPRLILFGGATALEGNSAASGTPSSAGSAGIRLAGATADVHCYDVLTNKWSRITPFGEPPTPRAAHVATAVGTMVVIQGGIGPAGLSAEDLHVLDLTQPRPRWHRVVVQGPGPGPRYGHVMALVGQRFLMAIGGNDGKLSENFVMNYLLKIFGASFLGKRPLADVWALDTAAKPYEWRKLEPEGEGPPPCMLKAHSLAYALSNDGAKYATASARSDGLLLLCGGRDANSVPLASAYGLAKHRDGRWEWAIAPGVSPSPRYQHAAVFVNARLHVSGGALGGGRMVEDSSSVAVLDTAAGVWCDTKSVVTSPRTGRYSADAAGGDASVELTRRCRHAAAAIGDLIFIYGGLRGGKIAFYSTICIIKFFSLSTEVIAHLLKPRGWKPPVRRQFFLDCNEIADLCESAERIFAAEPTVLQLKAPIKIFGDLHGQFGDLMRLFDEYGSPSTAGDIAYIDYVFLGDYVDRGQHSLETISLLLALKIEYPNNVHLIRGNHEAADINALFGFRIECIERMGERDGIWAWHRINRLFNWLPLAALIEKKIICMHGGIGRSINHVEQIESLQRPITMEAGSIVLMDLLWSDPTENDSVEGLRPNARGPGLVTFGPDRVMEFCNNNDLQLIVRAHECVMDGFERFAQGHLITLFSATNYCGTANNAGAILVLGRDLVVVPKLIHPLPPAMSSPEASSERHIEDTWMQELNANRPPTPTRGRPQVTNDRGSLAWV